MRLGIPYKVVGGTSFYDRREVKDALAYLRAVVNPVDEVSIKRVLNVPKRGVGDSTVGRLDAWADGQRRRVHRRAAPSRRRRRVGRAVKGIAEFLELLDDLHGHGGGRARRRCSRRILDRTGYVAELQAEHSIEAEGRLENLAELIGVGPRVRDGQRVPRAGVAGRRHRRARATTTRRSC